MAVSSTAEAGWNSGDAPEGDQRAPLADDLGGDHSGNPALLLSGFRAAPARRRGRGPFCVSDGFPDSCYHRHQECSSADPFSDFHTFSHTKPDAEPHTFFHPGAERHT